ncbi:hypothetical protein FDUTEX481_02608 [Tolypothrix sp. PCC 7601]|nr:hypothetical protein FDUTEX481_02608 [Tolypothrix sp. PCC 7601]
MDVQIIVSNAACTADIYWENCFYTPNLCLVYINFSKCAISTV